MAKVEEEFSENPWLKEKWLLYRLSPARDLLGQLSAMIYKEPFVKKKKKSKSVNLSANVLGQGGDRKSVV